MLSLLRNVVPFYERVGIPELGRDCHSSSGSSGDISIPPTGRQPRSPECSTQVKSQLYIHAGLFRTPRTSQPNSPQVRSGTSEMAHFSFGYTKLCCSCTPPDSHCYTCSLSMNTNQNTFHFLHMEHFQYMKISISNKL